jgi:DNA polymerase III epsilon subunit family exonuclease
MNRGLRMLDFGFWIGDCRPRAHTLLAAALLAATGLVQAAPLPATALSNVTFVAFDTETTGLSAKRGRLVEIAAVRFRNGVSLATNVWLINPGMDIPPEATRVHGITDAMVRNEPFFHQIAPRFRAFAGDAVLIAHNARFDTSFLAEELQRNAMPPLTNAVLDSLKLARRWFPKAPDNKLATLAEYLKIPPVHYHRAGADTDVLVAIFNRGVQQMGPGVTLDDLKRLGSCSPPPPRKSRAVKLR